MWLLFSFSFVVALSGAMAPGPLLTYTIIRTLDRQKRGYLVGLAVITGHAILEIAVIVLLLIGFAPLLQDAAVVTVIGITGGLCLILMGVLILRDVLVNKVGLARGAQEEAAPAGELDESRMRRLIKSPVLGGFLVSMSNPYWWIWWATVGFAFMLRYELSFAAPVPLIAFFLGHEAGDLAWYFTVSTTVHFGRRWLTDTLYRILLAVCGAAMIGFGLYLGISVLV